MFIRCVAIIFALSIVGLSGCSTLRSVDAQVQSFEPAALSADAAPQRASSFQFERLPSLPKELQGFQDRLEAAASARLNSFGMQNAATSAAKFSILVTSRSQRAPSAALSGWPHASWDHHWDGFGRTALILRGTHFVWIAPTTPWPGGNLHDAAATHEVSVMVRERASGEIVHEAQARSSSRARAGSPDAELELIALLNAALRDFPKATTGLRRDTLEIGRAP